MQLTRSIPLGTHVQGFLIYAAGDTAAALVLHQFSLLRLLGMALVGGLLYSVEVPAFFRWLDARVPARPDGSQLRKTSRAALTLLYFNPLWIARHYVFLAIFGGATETISLALLPVAGRSFLLNAPVSLAANYYIQNCVATERRFMASSIFSGFMAVSYALSAAWL
ncbi:hypothetical protein ACFP2F_17545 [Hymenobacter artigasi]|uniref:Uncharacterized protein n=1 Tax=Hymenobacter artigasi TaxID=2719616 RepID=A0ABX1HQ77_9BACT|nr:hypothetical protein [Hymenobacter artigasi]NKI91256.1 hypothetical protein [Hymenobacter artigasi]